MQPDASTPSHQGSEKNSKHKKTGNTVSPEDIPADNLAPDETPTPMRDGGNVEHNPRHRKNRPELGVNRGLHS
jgi:hypothetical protein